MNTITSSHPDPLGPPTVSAVATATRPPASPSRARLVTDAPMRMFHWLFALSFVGAYISADSEHWRLLHVVLGYTMAGLLVGRLVYGLVGPRPARVSVLWRKVSGTRAWLHGLVASCRAGDPITQVPWRQGQNLLMSGALLGLLVMVIPMTLTGYATFHDWGDVWGGEVFAELHEFLGDLYLMGVLAHLALLGWLSFSRRKNQAMPMLTGRIPGPGPDLVAHERRWLAAVLLVSVCAYWVWEIVNRWL